MKKILFYILLASPALTFAQEKPNIVFILADDLTRFDIACYGSADSKTPTIDKLAADGMRFTRCYQAAPMCSPTRHNIYTGIYPTRTGAYPNHTFANPGTKSIVHHLEPLGYRIALSGKRHISPAEVFPFEYLGKKKNPEFGKVDSFLLDVKAKKEPFCLFLCSNEPHSPWDKGDVSLFNPDKISLPPHYVDNEETRKAFCQYLAEINYLDQQVKQALDLLEKHGLSGNTVFIFASEQGNSFPFAKWTGYNAGLGSALIVRWPGVVKPGSTSDALVEYSDITPTLIDIAGGDPVKDLDGFSMVPLLKGKRNSHKKFSHGMMTTRGINSGSDYYPIRTVSNGTYRYILNLTSEVEFSNVAKMPNWEMDAETKPSAAEAIQKHKFRPALELYNDLADPFNLENLAGQKPYRKIQKKLEKQLRKWMKYSGDEGVTTELLAFERMNKLQADGIYLIEDYLDPLASGNLDVPADGYYTFYVKGEGGLSINNQLIVRPKGGIENRIGRYGVIALRKGRYKLEPKEDDPNSIIEWSGPDFKKARIR